jgi:hypothetical protein
LGGQFHDLRAVGLEGNLARPPDQQPRRSRGFGFRSRDCFGVGVSGGSQNQWSRHCVVVLQECAWAKRLLLLLRAIKRSAPDLMVAAMGRSYNTSVARAHCCFPVL